MDKQEVERIKQQYAITEEEFTKMYLQAKSITFANCMPAQSKPIAIFIGGQPGAGKSGLILKTSKEFLERNQDLIVFDLDMYRGLYKSSLEIAKKYPDLYSEITGKAAGRIMEMLSTEAIQNGYNFVLEGTMGGQIYTLDVLQSYRSDYQILARLLAVSREESLLSIFERYIEMKKSMGIGRMTTIESHEKKYHNFLNVAETLERRGVEVEVYERSVEVANPKRTYKTSKADSTYSSVKEAIIMGRNNSQRICMKTIASRIESIKNDLKEIGEEKKFERQTEALDSLIKKEEKVRE